MSVLMEDAIHTSSRMGVFTQPADKALDFAIRMREDWLNDYDYEWVDIGDFYPVVINGGLCYTFTIRGGYLT